MHGMAFKNACSHDVMNAQSCAAASLVCTKGRGNELTLSCSNRRVAAYLSLALNLVAGGMLRLLSSSGCWHAAVAARPRLRCGQVPHLPMCLGQRCSLLQPLGPSQPASFDSRWAMPPTLTGQRPTLPRRSLVDCPYGTASEHSDSGTFLRLGLPHPVAGSPWIRGLLATPCTGTADWPKKVRSQKNEKGGRLKISASLHATKHFYWEHGGKKSEEHPGSFAGSLPGGIQFAKLSFLQPGGVQTIHQLRSDACVENTDFLPCWQR